MGILNTVTYAVAVEDALEFATFLETLRLEDVYKECTGLPDGSEVKMDRCFAYPFSEYGDVKEACRDRRKRYVPDVAFCQLQGGV